MATNAIQAAKVNGWLRQISFGTILVYFGGVNDEKAFIPF